MSTPIKTVRRLIVAALAAATTTMATSGVACAQQMNTSSSSYNAGYGRTAGTENAPVNFSLRDMNGNLAIVDGVMNTGPDQSTLAGSAIADGGFSGVGGIYSAGASAIGNSLTVVTQGNYNTIIVNSVQTNNGNVTATGNLNTQVAGAH